MPKVIRKKKAISRIKNNSLIVFSGMQLNRAPIKLIYDLIRKNYKTKNKFRIVGTPNPIAMDLLIGANLIEEIEFCFMGFKYEYGFVIPKYFRRAIEKGNLNLKESGAYSIIQGLRAGAMNIDFIQLKNFSGSDLLKIKNPNIKKISNLFTNEKIIVRKAINPDFALIHAQYADKKGNIFIEDPLNERLLAKVSSKVIISVEKIVDKIKKNPTITSIFVDYIVKLPKGAWPCSCYKFYNYDKEIIKEYVDLDFEEYYMKYIKK
jgi:acyl CoA:acetate/3-ketoacid CoA transferase alpha subunit